MPIDIREPPLCTTIKGANKVAKANLEFWAAIPGSKEEMLSIDVFSGWSWACSNIILNKEGIRELRDFLIKITTDTEEESDHEAGEV